MNRDEYVSLPASIALGLLYDLVPALADVPAPRIPKAPKYDRKLSRKGGFYCWASELNLESLEFWHRKNVKSAAEGGPFADKNAKEAKELGYWVAYRRACPAETWSGERNRVKVRAEPPSREPALHAWEKKGEAAPAQSGGGGGFADADYGGGDDPDSIPFALSCFSEREAWWR